MPFTSTAFVLFVAAVVLVYYLIPSRFRPQLLLAASLIFYAVSSLKALVFIAVTTAASYWCGIRLNAISGRYRELSAAETERDRKKLLKIECKTKKKRILIAGLLVCFGILAALKYTNFLLGNLNALISLFTGTITIKPFDLLLPLGISFYTFQVTGYIIDMYYEKYKPETNICKYALCVSYFPALLQGPISRNNELRAQLFETEHHFSLENAQFAIQRILWGYVKKLVIADRAADIVSYIFDNHTSLPNYIVFAGLVAYSIQLYADFSGGMDVVLGVSELFGIKLTENFRQPFFSQSIGEFWRRWHISLGSWMKDYIFYPFSLSKQSLGLGSRLIKFNKFLGRVAPVCVANLLVFFVVGIWHGAEWHFIIYGLYSGVIIAASALLKPVFDKLIAIFHIKTQSSGWKLFRILRTFFLINLSWIFDDVTDLGQSASMLKQLFNFNSWHLIHNFRFISFGANSIPVIILFTGIWFIVSLMKERGCSIRSKIATTPLVVRWAIYLFLLFSTPFFLADNTAGFIYAQF